jgi:hypothetical protein
VRPARGSAAGLRLAPAAIVRRARGRAVDVILFAGGIALMLFGLAVLNEDVRRQFAGFLGSSNRSGQVELVLASIARMVHPIAEMFATYWNTNPWLVGFGVITLVLFIFMFKA